MDGKNGGARGLAEAVKRGGHCETERGSIEEKQEGEEDLLGPARLSCQLRSHSNWNDTTQAALSR